MSQSDYNQKYNRSIQGVIVRMYYGQISSSKVRKHPKPNYTLSEFTEWCLLQPKFKALYEKWKSSNFIKELKPSTDRIKSKLPYTLENIQLMTWDENRIKRFQESYERSVYQCDKVTGEIIKEYESITKAAKAIKGNLYAISNCLKKGFTSTSAGYKWKYKTKNN